MKGELDMTSAQEKAYRFRRLILVVGIVFTLAGLTWAMLPVFFDMDDTNLMGLLGTVLICHPIGSDSRLGYAVNTIIVIGLVFLLQWAFLRPGKNFKVRLLDKGRPLRSSVLAASIMAMLLTVGLISLLLEFPNWWQEIMESESRSVVTAIYATMGVIWVAWAWVFFIYWKQGDRYTQSGKMIRGLVAGSILEIMIAVPVHIWATRQRECYCCRGTYTTLVLAGTVLIWAFGPGIILLYMREKYRRGTLIQPEKDASEIRCS
jgi:hypothetical protein